MANGIAPPGLSAGNRGKENDVSRRTMAAAAVAALVVMGLAACGSGESGRPATSATTHKPATTTEAVATATADAVDPLGDPIAERLDAAGYSVSVEALDASSGIPATAEVYVNLAGWQAKVYPNLTTAHARMTAKEFAPIEGEVPQQFEIRRIGTNVYVGTIEEPAKLPMREFNKIVAVAEAR
jgi:hypothetical protein